MNYLHQRNKKKYTSKLKFNVKSKRILTKSDHGLNINDILTRSVQIQTNIPKH